ELLFDLRNRLGSEHLRRITNLGTDGLRLNLGILASHLWHEASDQAGGSREQNDKRGSLCDHSGSPQKNSGGHLRTWVISQSINSSGAARAALASSEVADQVCRAWGITAIAGKWFGLL